MNEDDWNKKEQLFSRFWRNYCLNLNNYFFDYRNLLKYKFVSAFVLLLINIHLDKTSEFVLAG
jgi:hypothetical protein